MLEFVYPLGNSLQQVLLNVIEYILNLSSFFHYCIVLLHLFLPLISHPSLLFFKVVSFFLLSSLLFCTRSQCQTLCLHPDTECVPVIEMGIGDSVGSPGGSDGKVSACTVGDPGSIPGSGRSPGEGNGNQYSCLENSMDRGAWQATVHGVTKSRTRLSDFTFTFGDSVDI